MAFNVFSMLNHACAASTEENVCFSILSTGEIAVDDNLEVKLVAIRDIQAGEALRISYHELFAEPGARQERIRAHCGGFCACSRCHLEREEAGLAATLPLCVASKRAKCQVCSSEEPAEKGEVVELFGICHRELQGATAILREARSDGMCVELLHQGLRVCRSVPRDAVRRFDGDGKDLLKCGACKSVHFCSRSCQREGWKEHKRFCSTTSGSWQSDRAKLENIRKKYEVPYNRQSASESELASAFKNFEFYIEKWTQVGRSSHLGSGHQAIQEAILLAIPIGSLLLWKVASRDQAIGDVGDVGDIYLRLLKLAHMNLRNVRLLVPRFHIAHWTALYFVNGILLAKELVQPDALESQNRLVKAMSSDFERCLDIADVFDPNVAKSFRYGQSMQSVKGESTEGTQGSQLGSQLFQQMARDPSKLAAFYSIDAELPLEQKMEQMSRLLSEPASTSMATRNGRQADQADQTRKPKSTPNVSPKSPKSIEKTKISCVTTFSKASESQENPQSDMHFADLKKRTPVQQACAAVDLNMLD